MDVPNTIDVRLLQLSNAYSPISTNELGITIFSKPVSLNALYQYFVKHHYLN